jgi:hypothetical protein
MRPDDVIGNEEPEPMLVDSAWDGAPLSCT